MFCRRWWCLIGVDAGNGGALGRDAGSFGAGEWVADQFPKRVGPSGATRFGAVVDRVKVPRWRGIVMDVASVRKGLLHE